MNKLQLANIITVALLISPAYPINLESLKSVLPAADDSVLTCGAKAALLAGTAGVSIGIIGSGIEKIKSTAFSIEQRIAHACGLRGARIAKSLVVAGATGSLLALGEKNLSAAPVVGTTAALVNAELIHFNIAPGFRWLLNFIDLAALTAICAHLTKIEPDHAMAPATVGFLTMIAFKNYITTNNQNIPPNRALEKASPAQSLPEERSVVHI